eukprot:CAMPEP_0174352184 /NCGR_PEP_ID=MMETSP0811_2-20130205/9768_1 /TAXON_ID=73025 ORGANISM="Eutreptiella gymnastica-like, Strain CCMP1594" /NCGR_SAMPLE_ID=MMETSP0811_2 /ASSEMBLY_ACC=CAM_ASM_000667 /LENGTH=31 /DNA_ID= /DNA_START= /DNA_END= /DNA_ORIENTATION=
MTISPIPSGLVWRTLGAGDAPINGASAMPAP